MKQKYPSKSQLKQQLKISFYYVSGTEKDSFIYMWCHHRWARVLGQGGGRHRGCPQKNFPAAFGGRKIFRRRRHRGGKIFFRWGVYLVDRGVILPKNPKKWPHRGVKIFFPRGASHPGVHPPLKPKICPTPGGKKTGGGVHPAPGCEAPRGKKFLTPRWGHFLGFLGKITPRSTK